MGSKFTILKVIFIFLIVVTVLELVYYFYISNLKNKFNLKSIISESTTSNNQIQYPIKSSGDAALDIKTLQGLFDSSVKIPKDVLKTYEVKVQMEGILDKIEIQNGPPYLFRIAGNGRGSHQFIYPKDPQFQSSTLTIVGPGGEKMNIENLSIKDRVNVAISMDMTNSKAGQSKYDWVITKL